MLEQQLQLYNQSTNHALFKVEGLHMSFFEKKNIPKVKQAFQKLLELMSNKKAKNDE